MSKEKIVLISDESYIGGATITNRSIMEEGIRQGYDVEIYAYNKQSLQDKIEFNPPNADFYILLNYGYIGTKSLREFCIKNKNKYIRYLHDIPGFLQMIPSSFFNDAISTLQLICDNAAHVFMISPMQFEVVARQIKLDESKVTINPPFIDLSVFKNNKEKKKDSWLILGDIGRARGIEKSLDIIKQYNGKYVSIVGPETDNGYCKYLEDKYSKSFIGMDISPAVEYKEIPNLMSTFENFIYTPEIYDSFCRKVLEAQISGMKMFADTKRIGIYSYPEEYDFINGCKSANSVLWKILSTYI